MAAKNEQVVGKAINTKILLNKSGNTSDIIDGMIIGDSKAAPYTSELAQKLVASTIIQTCKNIWEFVKENITYKEDPDGFQFIQSPGYLFWGKNGKGGTGDCKSMSIFCASILQNLGIKYAYRFISQTAGNDLHHVFVVLPDERGKEIILDCVDTDFNRPRHYARTQDIRPKSAKLAGLGDGKLNVNTPYKEDGIDGMMDGAVFPYQYLPNLPNMPVLSKQYSNFGDYINEAAPKIVSRAKNLRDALFAELKKDWNTMRVWSLFEPISMLLLTAKGELKMSEYYTNVFDKKGFHQCMYVFWDDKEASFPQKLAEKGKQAKKFFDSMLNGKVNDRRTAGFKNGKKYVTDYTVRTFCDLDCITLYGFPANVMLRRAYNLENYGSTAIPYKGIPFWSKGLNKWVANGCTAEEMAYLDKCLPFGSAPFSKPLMKGTPYWSRTGSPIQNGATDSVFLEFATKGLKPNGLPNATNVPLPSVDTAYSKASKIGVGELSLDALKNFTGKKTDTTIENKIDTTAIIIKAQSPQSEWYQYHVLQNKEFANGKLKVSGFNHAISGGSLFNVMQSKAAAIKGNSAKIGAFPIAIIAPILAFIGTLIGIILKAVEDSKKSEADVQRDMTNYAVDFPEPYPTPDGGTMYPNDADKDGVFDGTWTKVDANGNIVSENADPNAAENLPMMGGFFDNLTKGKKIGLVFGGLAVLAGGYFLLSDSKK